MLEKSRLRLQDDSIPDDSTLGKIKLSSFLQENMHASTIFQQVFFLKCEGASDLKNMQEVCVLHLTLSSIPDFLVVMALLVVFLIYTVFAQ